MIFNPMKGTRGCHGYPVSSIANVKVEKDGNRLAVMLQNGISYRYDYAGSEAVWGESGLYPEEWQTKILEITNPPPPRIQEAQLRSTSEDPVTILKIRFAKGEITKKQYEKMKTTLLTFRTPVTKEELLRSAVKALEQGDKELAKKFMDQAQSMHD
jgi:hypothetical protein